MKQLNDKTTDVEQVRRIAEMKTLRNLRPCVDTDLLLRAERRLENADLPLEVKHPLILPRRHSLTRLIFLHEHSLRGHAGPAYTFMRTRQRFWVMYGISSVKRYISESGKCVIRKATPIRELMSDLPVCRVSATNKSFKFCGCDFLAPFIYRQDRSHCMAWGLLFTSDGVLEYCTHTRLLLEYRFWGTRTRNPWYSVSTRTRRSMYSVKKSVEYTSTLGFRKK